MNLFQGVFTNQILTELAPAKVERIAPYLEYLYLESGRVLYEPGSTLDFVYFPADCIISILSTLQDGSSAGVAVVGLEGLLGVSLLLGGETTTSRAIVQSAGYAWRAPAQWIKSEFQKGGPFMWGLLRYAQALMAQMTQTAVCNRHHSTEQQLCRWLLLCLDRLPTSTIWMTSDLAAKLLGVGSAEINESTKNLQRASSIRYVMGRIDVLDRLALEARVCECYGVVKLEVQRLLSGTSIPDLSPTDPDHDEQAPDTNRMALLVEVNERLVQVALAAQTAVELADADLMRLTRISQRDALTDTPNRALMLDRLQNAIGMAQRRGNFVAVLFLDVDHFKQINDNLGHAVGDAVLQLVSRRLESAVRDSDAVGRHGGDEFLVLLPEVSQISDISLVAEKILSDMKAVAQVLVHEFDLSISVGVAVYPDDGIDALALIGKADTAMYRSKRRGGSQFSFSNPAHGL